MTRHSLEPRTRKYVKGYEFLSFARKYKKQLLDTGLDSLKTAYKKVGHKASECMGNKTADTLTKSNDDNIEIQEPVSDTIVPPEKGNEILDKLRNVL